MSARTNFLADNPRSAFLAHLALVESAARIPAPSDWCTPSPRTANSGQRTADAGQTLGHWLKSLFSYPL
jgi:hypothetical protein